VELCIYSPIRVRGMHRDFSFLFNSNPTQGELVPHYNTTVEKGLNTENCALLGYYAASSGDMLLTFRDNLSILSSGVKNPVSEFIQGRVWPLKMGPVVVPKRR